MDLYKNVGKKMISVANGLCIGGMILSVIGGFGLMISDEDMMLIGLLSAAIGCLVSWLSALTLAGFGELVTCNQEIRDMLRFGTYGKPGPVPQVPSYQNAGYQNGYQNTGYQNGYQNVGHQNTGYQNTGYQAPAQSSRPAPTVQENVPTWKRLQMEEQAKQQ